MKYVAGAILLVFASMATAAAKSRQPPLPGRAMSAEDKVNLKQWETLSRPVRQKVFPLGLSTEQVVVALGPPAAARDPSERQVRYDKWYLYAPNGNTVQDGFNTPEVYQVRFLNRICVGTMFMFQGTMEDTSSYPTIASLVERGFIASSLYNVIAKGVARGLVEVKDDPGDMVPNRKKIDIGIGDARIVITAFGGAVREFDAGTSSYKNRAAGFADLTIGRLVVMRGGQW